MPSKTNRYFNNTGQSIGNRNERNLMQRLIDETIQIHGFQITYVIRDEDENDIKEVWREDTSPEFTRSFTIEAFLESYDGFEGQLMINTAYGLQLDQLAKIRISKARWREEHLDYPDVVPPKPLEGDLVLMTFGSNNNDEKGPLDFGLDHVDITRPKVFEVMHIEKEPDKFQLRGEYYYEIQLRLFDHSNEDISFLNKNPDTGETEKNYEFNEEQLINDLKTSGLDTIFANIDPDTGEESGNIVDVVKTAQNRELQIEGNKYSFDRLGPPTSNPGYDDDDCGCDGNGDDNNNPLICYDTLPEPPKPWPLPDTDCKDDCDCDEEEGDGNKGPTNDCDPPQFTLPKGW